MFSDVLYFLLNILFSLFGIALIIRAWMYAIRLHPFNPYSQAVLRATNWLVGPLRNIVKPSNRLDWPTLLACWLTALVYLLLTWVLLTGQLPSAEGLTRSLVAAVITVAKWAFNIVLWVTLIQAVLSWVNPMAPVMPLLHTLTAPAKKAAAKKAPAKQATAKKTAAKKVAAKKVPAKSAAKAPATKAPAAKKSATKAAAVKATKTPAKSSKKESTVTDTSTASKTVKKSATKAGAKAAKKTAEATTAKKTRNPAASWPFPTGNRP